MGSNPTIGTISSRLHRSCSIEGMASLPSELWINGLRWTVEPLDPEEADRDDISGLCHDRTHTIYVDKRMSMPDREEVLVHEVLHAIWPKGAVDHDTEEKLVEALCGPLTELLRKNKLLKPR